MKFEFVSWSGDGLCLCIGALKFKANGKLYTIGNDPDHPIELESGGEAFTDDEGNDIITHGPWKIPKHVLPKEASSISEANRRYDQ